MEIVDGIVRPRIFTVSCKRRLAPTSLTLLILLAVTGRPPALLAQEQTARLDPAQTKVEFTLADVLHTVHGTFKLKSGLIRFEPSTGSIAGTVVVDATSGESGNGTRDRKMHKEVLQSGQFPEIVFTPKHWKGPLSAQGPSRIEVTGNFLMHGEEREITLPMDVQADGRRLTITSRIVLPYVDWGIKNPSTFILRVSDKVTVDIRATAQLESGDPPR